VSKVARERLPRAVFALGTVSFLTDLGSEMILPLLPSFLATIGGSKQQLGLLQGLSEFIVAGMKLASGWLSDLQRRRKPWIVFGYGLSTLVRPLMSLVTTPWQVMVVRSADRAGKGLRTAPRDALLADSVPADRRGEAFGVQRGMDHAGALCGALLAALLLWLGCEQRTVFAAALVPGLFSVLVLVLFVRESKHADAVADEGTQAAPLRTVLPFLGVVALAAAGSAVDLFLLARAQELGVPVASLPLLWAVLHVARAGLSQPLGALSDRLGRRRVIACGLLAHTFVMVGFACVEQSFWMWPLFAVHGLHAAFTEGAERGYVADLTGSGKRGRSFGIYHAVQGAAAFAGPVLIGTVWDQAGARPALSCAVGATVLALGLLPFVPRARPRAGP
jgi:MFS family permease